MYYYLLVAEIAEIFFFSSRRRHTRFSRDWSSDVCSSDLVDPNDARLVKQRIYGGLGAGERGGVRARSPRAGGGPPCLHRDDRLRPRDAPRDARKLARVAEGLEIQQHDVGVRVLFPVLEQVVRGDIRFVADGHEGGEPQALFGRPLQQGESERATLRRKTDLAGWKRTRAERGIQSNVGHSDA